MRLTTNLRPVNVPRGTRNAAWLLLVLIVPLSLWGEAPLPLDRLRLPPGFHIDVYARVHDARSMTLSPSGVLYVGTRDAGSVYAVLDPHHENKGTRVIEIAKNLEMPNGVAFRDGALYVAEVSKILRFDGIESRLDNPPKPSVINGTYPNDQAHGWKFIAFGPDGWLYVPVGAPCNICEPPGPLYAAITRIKPDGSGREVYARGIRNTVGFDWDPDTKALWFTDNGRDNLGDNSPPDELNRAPRAGLHFGYPYCHGGTIADPEFGSRHACSEFVKPEMPLGPHVAALGVRFYTGTHFPADYRHRIFIAEHGSWNRTHKIGYRVSTVTLENGKAVRYEPFATGWLAGEEAWGRPVDVQGMPDGSLLVSDDLAGAIYRITWRP